MQLLALVSPLLAFCSGSPKCLPKQTLETSSLDPPSKVSLDNTFPSRMAIFHNDSRISKDGVLHKLVPTKRDYDYPLCMVTIHESFAQYRSPGRVLKSALVTVLSKLDVLQPHMDTVRENMEQVRIVVNSQPSLRQLLTNNSQLARVVSPDDATVPSPCPCLSGPYAQHVDVNIGHVATTSMSLLSSVHPDLAHNHVGNNMRVTVQDDKSLQKHLSDALLAMTEVLKHAVTDVLVQLDTVEQHVYSKKSRRLFCKMAIASLRLLAASDHKGSILLTCDSLEAVDNLQDTLMITVLDKVASAFLFICKPFAMSLIALRFQNGPYTVRTPDELANMVVECSTILIGMGLPPAPSQAIPYVYPILKLHKCPAHDPRILHDCKFEWRFIQSASGAFTTVMATMVAVAFKATFAAIETKRDLEYHEFYRIHGFKLRFRFGITAWQTLVLNLPAQVPSDYTVNVGDIKDAFPSLPLHGPQGVFEMTRHHVLEAFGAAGKAFLAIPVDDTGAIRGKAKFVNSESYSDISFGSVSRHIVLSPEDLYYLIVKTLELDLVGSTEVILKPTIGVPIGGPASSYLLEATADQWEYKAALRIAKLANSTLLADRALAKRLAACLRYYWRYADDIISIAEVGMPALLWQADMPGPNLLDPMWIYPLKVTGEDWELSIKPSEPRLMDDGKIMNEYLSLTIALSPITGTVRYLSYSPYSKRKTFEFLFPMLTLWTSATKKAVKMAAIDTMIQYAILGSTDLTLSIRFLTELVDRLVINGYPRHALLQMWQKTVKGTLKHIPCREALYTGRMRLVKAIYHHINKLPKK